MTEAEAPAFAEGYGAAKQRQRDGNLAPDWTGASVLVELVPLATLGAKNFHG